MADDQGDAPRRRNPDLINYTWMAIAVLSPLAMCLPPRRMDARFLALTGGFSISTDQLLKDYTGEGIYSRFASRVGGTFSSVLPERAQETKRRLREERERMEATLSDEERRLLDERRNNPGGLRGLFTADEGADWKEKRLEAHKKGLEEGKGISDLILEHMSEAFKKEEKDAKDKAGKDEDGKEEKK